jgi:hypothetical protein
MCGLIWGDEFIVEVLAVNSVGKSTQSVESKGLKLINVPSSVKGMKSAASKTQIGLTWTDPDQSRGAPISNYTVYWHDTNDNVILAETI